MSRSQPNPEVFFKTPPPEAPVRNIARADAEVLALFTKLPREVGDMAQFGGEFLVPDREVSRMTLMAGAKQPNHGGFFRIHLPSQRHRPSDGTPIRSPGSNTPWRIIGFTLAVVVVAGIGFLGNFLH